MAKQFDFNDRTRGIFNDKYVDRNGTPVGDVFAYLLKANIFGVPARDWTVERLAAFIRRYTSNELDQIRVVIGSKPVAIVNIKHKNLRFYINRVNEKPASVLVLQTRDRAGEMVADFLNNDKTKKSKKTKETSEIKETNETNEDELTSMTINTGGADGDHEAINMAGEAVIPNWSVCEKQYCMALEEAGAVLAP